MRYFLCPGYTDMRKGMFTLCGLVHERMGGDIRSGEVFIFYNRFRTKIKLLHAEPGGLVLYEKLLEEGTFKIPAYNPATRSYPMTWSDLVVMVEGINEDVSKGKTVVNKQLEGLFFLLFLTIFISSKKRY